MVLRTRCPGGNGTASLLFLTATGGARSARFAGSVPFAYVFPAMVDPQRFAFQLARSVDSVRNAASASNCDWQAVVAPLAELASQQSATIRLSEGVLSVEGTPVPDDASFIEGLIDQMLAHGIAAVQLAH